MADHGEAVRPRGPRPPSLRPDEPSFSAIEGSSSSSATLGTTPTTPGSSARSLSTVFTGAFARLASPRSTSRFFGGHQSSDLDDEPEPPIRLGVFTWNVGNAPPDAAQLSLWLAEGGDGLDVLAVGTQENKFSTKDKAKGASAAAPHISLNGRESDGEDETAEEASLSAGPARNSAADAADAAVQSIRGGGPHRVWEKMILARLAGGGGGGRQWVVLKHASLRQMHLAVFVRAALRTSAHSVRSAVSATGLGGVVGNKGGLAISFHLGTTSLAFVSCHLAAHDHKNRERNEMCKEILSETAGAIGEQRRAARGRLDVASQFDHCFWFGDLNYRVDLKLGQQAAGLPAEALKEHEAHHAAVRDLVEEEDWEALWEADQLRHSQRAGDVLARFSEGQYSFPPTFKVLRQRGAHYKQQRIPSYCDRILWRSMPGRGSSAVTQTSLAAVPGVSTSDHKPVFATFEVAASARLHGAAGSSRAQHEATATTCARLGSLSLQGIIPADLSGRSDPYIAFFTNPPGLLGGSVPTSSVKKGVLATGTAVTGEARAWRAVMGGSVRGPSAGFGGEGADDTCSWCEAELPLLRFSCSLADLRHVTLILAVFDRDIGSKDDPLGTAMVPLSEPVERLLRAGGGAAGRSSGEASGEGPRRGEGGGGDSSGSGGALAEAPGGSIGAQSHSWPRSSARGAWGRCSTGGEGVGGRLEVSQPLVWKGTTRGTGQLSCSLTVGAGLSFVADAVQSGAGSRSSHLSNNVFLSVPLKLRALRALAPRKAKALTQTASRPSLLPSRSSMPPLASPAASRPPAASWGGIAGSSWSGGSTSGRTTASWASRLTSASAPPGASLSAGDEALAAAGVQLRPRVRPRSRWTSARLTL
uniref:Inositol polyphosphate-related phosphatase domain-containing protein n=1 Tax=Emiliania huxleyi TaxID=2903 RepID=A0A6V2VPM4_EMIHU